MYSHALVHYQDSLITFCDKVAKTFKHVESSFKGYQPYEFTYIKELAEPSRYLINLIMLINETLMTLINLKDDGGT